MLTIIYINTLYTYIHIDAFFIKFKDFLLVKLVTFVDKVYAEKLFQKLFSVFRANECRHLHSISFLLLCKII